MKLVLAIINRSDEKTISSELMKGGFSVTKISSTGGLIRNGLTTIVTVCRTDRLQNALDILKTSAKARKYEMSRVLPEVQDAYGMMDGNHEIIVGGATVFVLNVEESYKF